jgi:hypothetical protein
MTKKKKTKHTGTTVVNYLYVLIYCPEDFFIGKENPALLSN